MAKVYNGQDCLVDRSITAYHPFEEEESLPSTEDITTPESVRVALESIKKQMKARYVQLIWLLSTERQNRVQTTLPLEQALEIERLYNSERCCY